MSTVRTKVMYYLVYCFVWPLFNLFHPVRAIGRENIPEGGAVFCANHSGLSDPLYFCYALTRRHRIRPMAKIELSRVPLIGPILGMAGVIYVDRGNTDIKAVKTALQCLKNGEKMLVFPEGTRVKEGEKVEAKGGAILFATRTGVPIVPVYISQKKYWFRPSPVVIGKPFYPQIAGRKASAEELDAIAQDTMREIYRLGEGV